MLSEILIILALILLNGLFSLSEISIVSSKRIKLEGLIRKGSKGAKAALKLGEDSTRFLSSVQIGITLIGILTGFYSGGGFSQWIMAQLIALGLPEKIAQTSSTVITVGIITYASLVVGELVPKKIGLLKPERIAVIMAPPMQLISKIGAPLVSLLSGSTNLIVRILQINTNATEEVTEEEVKSLIAQGTSTCTFERVEQTLVDRVFHFSDRNVGSVMVSRMDIQWIDINADVEQNIEAIATSPHSHILLCDGQLELVKGVVSTKAVLKSLFEAKKVTSLEALSEKPYYLSVNLNVLKALEKLKSKKKHLALTINEFGDLQGLITLADIVNSLFSEIAPNHQDQKDGLVELGHNIFEVEGAMPYAEFYNQLEISLPTEETTAFNTMAGLFLNEFKSLPKQGDRVILPGFTLEVITMVGNRIDKMRAVLNQ